MKIACRRPATFRILPLLETDTCHSTTLPPHNPPQGHDHKHGYGDDDYQGGYDDVEYAPHGGKWAKDVKKEGKVRSISRAHRPEQFARKRPRTDTCLFNNLSRKQPQDHKHGKGKETKKHAKHEAAYGYADKWEKKEKVSGAFCGVVCMWMPLYVCRLRLRHPTFTSKPPTTHPTQQDWDTYGEYDAEYINDDEKGHKVGRRWWVVGVD